MLVMLKVTEIAFACYAVTDLARARAFYEGVLGLTSSATTSPQWVEYEIGAHTLSIGSAPGWNPSPDGCTVALEVEDFAAAVATLKQAGTKFRAEPFPRQSAAGRGSSPPTATRPAFTNAPAPARFTP